MHVLAGASVNLVFDFDNTGVILPSKVPKLMASHRPVLGIGAPGGELHQAIEKTSAGAFIPYDDPTALGDVLLDWHRQFKNGGVSYRGREQQIQDYSFQQVTRTLGTLLDDLV